MAKKEPVLQHRVKIHAETTAELMGPLLIQLTVMGLENIGYEIITDIPTFKNRVKHETSATDALTGYIAEHPTFSIGDAVKHFEQEGRTAGAIYTAARVLVEDKVLRKLGSGNYQSVHVRTLPAPKQAKEAAKKTRARNPVAKYDVPNKDLIAKAIRGRKRFTMKDMNDLFARHKRNPKSISPIITKMVQAKEIKITEPGQYEVLPKKQPASKKKPKAAHSALNGAAAPDAGAAANE